MQLGIGIGILITEKHIDIAGGRIFRLHFLRHVSIYSGDGVIAGHGIQASRGITVESVVELHDIAHASPVRIQRLFHRLRELHLQLGIQKVPIGIAPPVYALFHVTHYKISVAGSITVRNQRTEIFPLDIGGVLKLVQKEMVVAHPDFLIDERSVATVNDALQYGVRVVQAEHVLFPFQVIERIIDFPAETERIYLGLKDLRRAVFLISPSEKRYELIQRRVQFPVHQRQK